MPKEIVNLEFKFLSAMTQRLVGAQKKMQVKNLHFSESLHDIKWILVSVELTMSLIKIALSKRTSFCNRIIDN
tara:strand:+ start:178360 stop:178578 length:219 start_codon:yes stop_codon:yes gene_type:complete